MFGGKELRDLELRRQELVLQSTLNRLTMKLELENLRTTLLPADRIVSSVRALRPWLLLLAPLAGIFAARGFRSNGTLFSKAMGLLKWIQALLALWKQFKSVYPTATPESPPAATDPQAGP